MQLVSQGTCSHSWIGSTTRTIGYVAFSPANVLTLFVHRTESLIAPPHLILPRNGLLCNRTTSRNRLPLLNSGDDQLHRSVPLESTLIPRACTQINPTQRPLCHLSFHTSSVYCFTLFTSQNVFCHLRSRVGWIVWVEVCSFRLPFLGSLLELMVLDIGSHCIWHCFIVLAVSQHRAAIPYMREHMICSA